MERSSREGTARWWEFRGRSDLIRREELELFRRRLRSALRVGHGVSARFFVRWEGGRAARILFGADARPTQRWIVDLLAPSFDAGPWSEVRLEPDGDPKGRVRFAVPAPAFSPGAPHELDEPGWGEVAASGLSQLPPGTSVVWEYRAVPRPPYGPATIDRAEYERLPPGVRPRNPSAPERRVADERLRSQWDLPWAGRGSLGSSRASDPASALAVASRLLAPLAHHPGHPGMRFGRPWPILRPRPPWFLLGESELVSALPSPWTRAGPLHAVRGPAGPTVWIGAEGRPGSVRLPTDPENGRHLVIVGETGMGKSSLVVHLGVQASRHASVVLLDPIGDTGERFLDRLGPAGRARAVWVSPSRSAVGLNALAPPRSSDDPEADADRNVSDLVNALRRVRSHRYGETPFWGPRIEESVTLALNAAAAYPGGTIETAERLLERQGRSLGPVPEPAQRIVAALKDRIAQRPEEVDGARRLLAEITRSRVLRRLLCEPRPRWSMTQALSPGRITVVTGDAPRVGEGNARYLLAVELALLWSALVARRTPEKVFVLMDEAQWFAHESAAEMLRMGRRFNVHVVLATQALQSLPEAVRESALTNAADLVLFRGSPAEAREIARWVPGVSAERLLTLPRGHAAVLVDKGRSLDWAVVPGIPPSGRREERLGGIAHRSTESFGAPAPTEAGDDPARGEVHRALGSGPVGALDAARRETHLLVNAVYDDTAKDGVAEVPLAFLRQAAADPSGEALRRVGRELKGSGRLMRTLRDERGSIWLLGAPLATAELVPPATPEERDRAQRLWERWRDGRASAKAFLP